jgi:hypothetical protein
MHFSAAFYRPKAHTLLFLSLLGTSLGASTASAANHYIRAGATGNGSGSDWTNACTDFTGSCAVSSLVRGDKYYMAAGSYAGRTFNRAESGTLVITIKRATVADHGTNTGWNNSYDGQVRWTDGVDFGTTGYWVWDGATAPPTPLSPGADDPNNYGFVITDASSCGSARQAILTASNNTFRNFAVTSPCREGTTSVCQFAVKLWNPPTANVTISHFYAENNITDVQGPPGSASSLLVEYHYSKGQWSHPNCHGEVIAVGGTNATFRYSYYDQCKGTGCIASNGPNMTNWKIYGNVMNNVTNAGDGCNSGGNGAIAGAGAAGIFYNAEIYNNTIIQPGMCYGWFYANGGTGNVAYNNIIKKTCDVTGQISLSNNVYYACLGSSPSEQNKQTISTSPFVNEANLDFRLAVDTNIWRSLSSPYDVDMEGKARTSSRGAFQFGTAIPGGPQPAQNVQVTAR